MNRHSWRMYGSKMCMPHVCGDEPKMGLDLKWIKSVCPTYVGMNRGNPMGMLQQLGMPHVCGDEPSRPWNPCHSSKYAPRMWG